MAAKILRKLTIKEAVGGKAELLKIAQTGKEKPDSSTGKAIPILMVIGQAHGAVAGESDNGPYLKLKGEFEATNLVTGEIIPNVSTAILPNFVADMIASAMKANSDNPVDFGITFSVSYDETAATMYKFDAESLMPAEPARAVSAIKARLQQAGIALPTPVNVLALAAPAATNAPAPSPSEPAEVPGTKKTKK